MTTVTLQFPDDVFSALSRSPDESGRDLRLAAATLWYERGKISHEKAAQVAGLSTRGAAVLSALALLLTTAGLLNTIIEGFLVMLIGGAMYVLTYIFTGEMMIVANSVTGLPFAALFCFFFLANLQEREKLVSVDCSNYLPSPLRCLLRCASGANGAISTPGSGLFGRLG